MSIAIRLLAKGESGRANDFFNAIYKSNRSLKDFEWEFINGPAGPSIYVIALDIKEYGLGQVVGIQCAIPLFLMNAKGERILTAKSEDTLVDPAYRGQKIFERMYDLLFEECRKAGIKFIWGFTPAKKAFERIGFGVPFQAHQALMVINPGKAYHYLSSLNPRNGKVEKMKIGGLSLISWLLTKKRSRLPENTYRLQTASWESNRDLPRNLLPDSNHYFLEMSVSYITWRMDHNPFGNNYENYHCFDGTKLVANVIVNFREPRLGYIEQIIFDAQISTAQKQHIVSMVIDEVKSKTDLIRVLCFDINDELLQQEEILKRTGFVVLKRGAHFVWKSLQSDQLEPNQLFLSRLFTQGNQ